MLEPTPRTKVTVVILSVHGAAAKLPANITRIDDCCQAFSISIFTLTLIDTASVESASSIDTSEKECRDAMIEASLQGL